MKMLSAFSAVLLLGFLGNGAAQQKPSAQPWASITQLGPGAEIRVALAGGRTVSGKLQSATEDSVAVQTSASQETLARTDIKAVQSKGKNRRGRNVLIGVAIGAGSGLAIGAAVDHKDSGKSFNFLPNAGKVVFTPLGAIIGAIVGVAIPTGGWREIYRAP